MGPFLIIVAIIAIVALWYFNRSKSKGNLPFPTTPPRKDREGDDTEDRPVNHSPSNKK